MIRKRRPCGSGRAKAGGDRPFNGADGPKGSCQGPGFAYFVEEPRPKKNAIQEIFAEQRFARPEGTIGTADGQLRPAEKAGDIEITRLLLIMLYSL